MKDFADDVDSLLDMLSPAGAGKEKELLQERRRREKTVAAASPAAAPAPVPSPPASMPAPAPRVAPPPSPPVAAGSKHGHAEPIMDAEVLGSSWEGDRPVQDRWPNDTRPREHASVPASAPSMQGMQLSGEDMHKAMGKVGIRPAADLRASEVQADMFVASLGQVQKLLENHIQTVNAAHHAARETLRKYIDELEVEADHHDDNMREAHAAVGHEQQLRQAAEQAVQAYQRQLAEATSKNDGGHAAAAASAAAEQAAARTAVAEQASVQAAAAKATLKAELEAERESIAEVREALDRESQRADAAESKFNQIVSRIKQKSAARG